MTSFKRRRIYNYHPFVNDWMYAVEQGKVHSSKEIKMLMPLVRSVLDDKNTVFVADQVEQYARIAEKYYFKLMLDELFYGALILSVFDKETNLPVFPITFIMAGRGWGKNGFISTLAHFFISPYHGVPKYDVDIVATSENQAMTSFLDVHEVIEDMGAKGKRLYDYTKVQIMDRKSRSRLRYRTSFAGTKDGGRPGCVIFDEVHAYENYDLIKVFTGGLGKKDRPRRIYITTDGEVRDGVIDDYKERARRILTGECEHKGFLPIIMKLDTIQEVGKFNLWDKAIPRLNYSEVLKQEVMTEYEEALENENLMENFMTKRMNIPFVSRSKTVCTWEDLMFACQGHTWPDLTGLECHGSVDFADLRDFASVGLRWKYNGKVYFRQHSFIHEKSLRLKDYGIDIGECVRKGWATIVRTQDHETIPASMLAAWFEERAQEEMYISKIKADSFRFPAIKETFISRGLPETIEIRSGAISHNKVAPIIDILFANHDLVLEDDKLLRWFIWNVKRVIDKKGNINYQKIEPIRRKTDGFFCFLHSMIDDDLTDVKKYIKLDFLSY